MGELPTPPLPPDADLRDFHFMPLHIARLKRSRAWLICKRRPELAFYLVNLWTAAWHGVPAGSIEDDDDVLADLAMCSPRDWPEIKEDVLRGWIKCADRRLYHPIVVEIAAESWDRKLAERWRRECDRIRKENHRRERDKEPALPFPSFEAWKIARVPAVRSTGNGHLSDGKDSLSTGKDADSAGRPTENDPIPRRSGGKGRNSAGKRPDRDRDRDRDRDSRGPAVLSAGKSPHSGGKSRA